MFDPVAERDIAEIETLLNYESLAAGEQHLLIAKEAALLGAEIRKKIVQRLASDGLAAEPIQLFERFPAGLRSLCALR